MDHMRLRAGMTFLAADDEEGTNPLLCEVLNRSGDVIYARVENGAWDIGFSASTGQAIETGTDRQALPQALSSRIIRHGPFKGRGYEGQIENALRGKTNDGSPT